MHEWAIRAISIETAASDIAILLRGVGLSCSAIRHAHLCICNCDPRAVELFVVLGITWQLREDPIHKSCSALVQVRHLKLHIRLSHFIRKGSK